jgi:hypothetical protein
LKCREQRFLASAKAPTRFGKTTPRSVQEPSEAAHSAASPLPVLGERGHCLLREHDGAAALHGLRRQELALPQRAPHGQDAPLEVHVLPGESQELPPPEPGGDRHDVEGFVAAATCSLKEGADQLL